MDSRSYRPVGRMARRWSAIAGLCLILSMLAPDAPQAVAASNFTCNVEKGICACDVNVPGDCDNMKRNCYEGTIGWCNGTRCMCPLELVGGSGQGAAPKPGVRDALPKAPPVLQRK